MSTSGISFPGVGSGLNVQRIVDRLVEVQSGELNQLQERRDEVRFEQQVVSQVNSRLVDFDLTLSKLRLESTFLNKTTESSSPGLVSAEAEPSAQPGSHTVNIEQTAEPSRAESGLDGALTANRALLPANTAGINGLNIGNDFGGTAADSLSDLLTETRQAGSGDQEVTAGDTITIEGRTKDGTLRTGTFTFNGDGTDTIRRFAQKVRETLQGEVEFEIGSNGEIKFTETDPSAPGDVVLDPNVDSATGFTFNDTDFSGSTFDIGINDTLAGTTNRTQVVVENKTLTNGGAVAAAGDDLNALDQSGPALDSGDQINISGTDKNGNSVSGTFTYGAGNDGTTVNDLVNQISSTYGTSTASFENGKIVLRDDSGGDSQTTMQLEFSDQGSASNIDLGDFLISTQGADNVSQAIYTDGFTFDAEGSHELHFTEGKAGSVTGTQNVTAQTTLSELGVSNFHSFTVDVDTPGGSVQPRPIFGLSADSTVQDLVDRVNEQAPDATAQLVDSGGNTVVKVSSSRAGQDVELTDASGGILENVILGGGTTEAASTDGAGYATAATTQSDDYTVVDQFSPDSGGDQIRRVASNDESNPISGLIQGVDIEGQGGSNEFTGGNALIVTSESGELNSAPSTRTRIFGSSRVSTGTQSTPGLTLNAALADAGFDEQPKNEANSPTDHTDGFFTINGTRIEVGDVNTTTVNEVIAAVNTSGAGVTMQYDGANDRFVLHSNANGPEDINLGGQGDTSNFLRIANLTEGEGAEEANGQEAGTIDPETPLADAGFDIAPDSGVFSINGVAIPVDAGVDSLNDVIEKVNNSDAGVEMNYDQSADRLVISQDLTEETTRRNINLGDPNDTSNFLVATRLNSSVTTPAEVGSDRKEAIFTVDGQRFTRKTNSVDDVTDGLTYDLKAPTPETATVTVNQDTERALDTLAEFIAQYNQTMELIDPEPLDSEERRRLEPLSEQERSQLSAQELNQRLQQRRELKTREIILNDSQIRGLGQRLRQRVTSQVQGAEIESIFELGLESAAAGGGASAATQIRGKLVADSTDKEEIRSQLEQNQEVMNNLQNNPDQVFELFAKEGRSEVSFDGSKDLSGGTTFSDSVRFEVNDGERSATVEFGAGFHSQSDILNTISSSLQQEGFGTDVIAFFDNNSQLNFRSSFTDQVAQLQINDLSSGSEGLVSGLGVTPGFETGQDPNDVTGAGRRTRDLVDTATTVGGSLFERLRSGGLFEQQLTRINEEIQEEQRQIQNLRERLRQRFQQMDTTVARLNQTSRALAGAIQSQQQQLGGGGGGGGGNASSAATAGGIGGTAGGG